MNLSGLITFWALIIAAYSLLPEYWKFKVRAFIGLYPTALAFLISSLLVIYSIIVNEDGLLVVYNDWSLRIYSGWIQILAYFVLVIYMAFSIWKLLTSRVTRSNLSIFRKLLTELQVKNETLLVADVLEDNIQRLAHIYDYRSPLNRIRHLLRKSKASQLPLFDIEPTTREQDIVSGLINQLTSDEDLTRFLLNYNIDIPLQLIELFEVKLRYTMFDWLDKILEILISDPGSRLFAEIRTNQNVETYGRRVFVNSRLLEFLFKDANLAKERVIWGPIGDTITRHLQSQPGGTDDGYNKAAPYYADYRADDRYRDSVFVGLEFFDFMIKESLVQNVKWHMQLYFLRDWIAEIVKNVTLFHNEWDEGYWEYPTKYAFHLYEIVHYQANWLKFARDNNIELPLSQDPIYNDNIIQCTADNLAWCLRYICECEELPYNFRRRQVTRWWNSYFELRWGNKKNWVQYAEFAWKCMLEQLSGGYKKQIQPKLLGCLVSGLTHLDEQKEWVDIQEYNAKLQELKELIKEYVAPFTKNAEHKQLESTLTRALGSEFHVRKDGVYVENRFSNGSTGPLRKLIPLPIEAITE